MPLPVHLVGSVNLNDAEAVFRDTGEALGELATRVPDGETGERLTWTAWLIPALEAHPLLESRGAVTVAGMDMPQFGLKAGAAAEEISFDSFAYVTNALESHATLGRSRQEGRVPADVRLQVSIPTPAAILMSFIDAPDRLLLERPLERGLTNAVREIGATLPTDELVFQWDSPAEVGIIEEVFPSYYAEESRFDGAVRRLSRLGAAAPAGAQLGFHLCYGDTGDVDNPEGSHWKNPDDLGTVVSLMNAIVSQTSRRVDYFHVPVPIARDDDAYFAPLDDLRLPTDCSLFLGLLHREDGIDGARRRAAAAHRHKQQFGVATECGMGRERRESISALLRLHSEAAYELETNIAERSYQ